MSARHLNSDDEPDGPSVAELVAEHGQSEPRPTAGPDGVPATASTDPAAGNLSEPDPDEGGGPTESDKFATSLVASIGGWRGMVDSGLPVIVFVIVNAVTSLTPAIWAALSAGVVVLAVRLIRRESVQQAISGFLAVAVAAFIAHRTGHARDYFLLGIWRNAVIGAIFVVSILVRWPLLGAAWEYLEGRGTVWRSNRRLLRVYTLLSLLWAGVFALRFGVQLYLYHRDKTGWLAGTSLAMGYPLFAVAAIVTVVVIRRIAPAGRISAAQSKAGGESTAAAQAGPATDATGRADHVLGADRVLSRTPRRVDHRQRPAGGLIARFDLDGPRRRRP